MKPDPGLPRWRCRRDDCPLAGEWFPGTEADMDAHIRDHHRRDEEARRG